MYCRQSPIMTESPWDTLKHHSDAVHDYAAATCIQMFWIRCLKCHLSGKDRLEKRNYRAAMLSLSRKQDAIIKLVLQQTRVGPGLAHEL